MSDADEVQNLTLEQMLSETLLALCGPEELCQLGAEVDVLVAKYAERGGAPMSALAEILAQQPPDMPPLARQRLRLWSAVLQRRGFGDMP
ncbi:hypothetical protein ASE17_19630 [Phenylobacterium sp. Root77]|jgi:hypothetical protein|uniref:hypothetical protein n=1 Tax=unclassified Phenylobacterium TaxID=2640670 RepID=UPI000701AD73|nr:MULTISPECIES: hypothetical protein [unclassified Phenylobacterium]KQW67020.1 hypothetical protein ASC73_17975 [Phenylobacterium sp. Root1277]KQW89713.1 hypothetical protein ASC79_18880 [Phenylobacterium sp. Root1290]KRC43419.1 hypothetical protein ASE17_19630 [Phenylobacterium sp. Root77]